LEILFVILSFKNNNCPYFIPAFLQKGKKIKENAVVESLLFGSIKAT